MQEHKMASPQQLALPIEAQAQLNASEPVVPNIPLARVWQTLSPKQQMTIHLTWLRVIKEAIGDDH